MSRWDYRLELKEEWKLANQGQITVRELARKVAQKYRTLPRYSPAVVELFDDLAEMPDANFDDFDDVMDALYDWADANRCWVATF